MRVCVADMNSRLTQNLSHGQIPRHEAEMCLLLNGDFLVRESMTYPGWLILTGLDNGQKKHFLLCTPKGKVRKQHCVDITPNLLFRCANG